MKARRLVGVVLRSVALGCGVSTVVLALTSQITVGHAILLLALGLTCLSLASLEGFSGKN